MNDLSSVVTGCAPCAPADVNSALCSPQRPRSVSTSDWASCLGEWNMRGSQHGWWEQQTQVGHGGPCPGNGGRGYQNHLILFVFRISESGWDLDFATNIHQHENELSWECVVCSGRNHGMARFFSGFPQKKPKLGDVFELASWPTADCSWYHRFEEMPRSCRFHLEDTWGFPWTSRRLGSVSLQFLVF